MHMASNLFDKYRVDHTGGNEEEARQSIRTARNVAATRAVECEQKSVCNMPRPNILYIHARIAWPLC